MTLEMNVYFVNQLLTDKNNLFLIKDEGKTREIMKFSRTEKYFNYKGDYISID